MSSCGRQHTPEQVAEILQLVVEHVPAASDCRTLCNLLQVSKGVQHAIQHSRGHCSLSIPSWDVQRGSQFLVNCAAWLPKHVGLVTRLSFGSGCKPVLLVKQKRYFQTARDTVGLALQLCATQAQAAAVATAAAAAASQHGMSAATPLPVDLQAMTAAVPWRLRHVEACCVLSPTILHSLGACTSLTSLDLTLTWKDSRDKHLLEALTCMHSLLRLQASLDKYDLKNTNMLGNTFVGSIRRLQRLQELVLGSPLAISAAQYLPSNLLGLTATLHHHQSYQAGLSMGHMTRLQQLNLTSFKELAEGAATQLPPNMTCLHWEGPLNVVAVGLDELQELHLPEAVQALPFLQHLSALPKLSYINLGLAKCSTQQLQRVLAGIGSAVQLSKVVLGDPSAGRNDPYCPTPADLGGVLLHPQLTKLPHLQHLDISSLDIQPHDAAHFTSLKSLTALQLYNCWGISDVAVAAMACHLSNLRWLELIDCNLVSPVVWPALGTCTALETLCIDSSPHGVMRLSGDLLHLLTGLTRLTSLTGALVETSQQDYDAFRAALPQLCRVEPVEITP